MDFISSVCEIPVNQQRSLYILDFDRTIIDADRRLIDPNTATWITILLRYHDVVICTYRDFRYCDGTFYELEILGLENILDQELARPYQEFGAGDSANNVFFATHKGIIMNEFINQYPRRWHSVYFVDDQIKALQEMHEYNPEVKLYLISQPVTIEE